MPERISRLTTIQRITTVAGLCLALASPVAAAVINSTAVAANQLTITGTGFSGTPLTVTFNGQKITVTSSTATQIVATLNPVPPAGTYRLVVQAGRASATGYVAISPAPNIVAQVTLKQQNGVIPLTTLVTPPADGVFRVSYTYIGAAGCNTQESSPVVLFWTDERGTEQQAVVADFNYPLGEVFGSIPVRDLANQPLSYEINSSFACPPYDLYLTVEQLQ